MVSVPKEIYLQSTNEINHSDNSFRVTNPSKWVKVTGNFENDSSNNHWLSADSGELDRGSPWTAFKSSFTPCPEHVNHHQKFGGAWFGYQGPLLVHDSNHFTDQDFIDLDDGHTNELDLIGLGSTAISRVLPTNPISDVPTALAELLREGIPGIPRHGLRPTSIGNPAGGYLGYQFGVKPFINDLEKFAFAVQNAEQLIDEYARRSGTLIRRRYDFEPAFDVTEVVFDHFGGTVSYLGGLEQSHASDFTKSAYGGHPGVRTDVITRTKRTWFSGAFTYFLPEVGNDLSSKLWRKYAEMRYLYGGISLSTAWNLLPYSWAVDWMTNAGDVLRNVEAFCQDGLVMAWGYIMERCDFHVRRRVNGAYFSTVYQSGDSYTLPSEVACEFSKTYMRRRKATPFGFGLDVDGFTNRQKAIITALAIQRVT